MKHKVYHFTKAAIRVIPNKNKLSRSHTYNMMDACRKPKIPATCSYLCPILWGTTCMFSRIYVLHAYSIYSTSTKKNKPLSAYARLQYDNFDFFIQSVICSGTRIKENKWQSKFIRSYLSYTGVRTTILSRAEGVIIQIFVMWSNLGYMCRFVWAAPGKYCCPT